MSTIMKNKACWLALVLLSVSLMTGAACALDVYLAAKPFTMTMPDATVVPMWGYESYTDATFTTVVSPVSSPGPLIVIPVGDTSLTIHLMNLLPEPTSVMIPQLYAPLSPVFFTDPQGRQRARSFTAETAPSAIGTYSWGNLRPGSFLYQSATHPAVQVQMGLYGGVKMDYAAGQAYPGQAYDLEQILFFSEIDYGLHVAVSTGSYGQPNSSYLTTIDYKPKYYLVNGAQYTLAQNVLSGTGTERVLVRCYNGGLKFHVAQLMGPYLQMIAEGGQMYPYPETLYSAYVPPGGTADGIVARPGAGTFHFMDRSNYPPAMKQVPDLNLDGLITMFDVAILTEYLAGTIHQGEFPFIAALASADLNQDGLVDSVDLIMLILITPR